MSCQVTDKQSLCFKLNVIDPNLRVAFSGNMTVIDNGASCRLFASLTATNAATMWDHSAPDSGRAGEHGAAHKPAFEAANTCPRLLRGHVHLKRAAD